MSAVQGDGRIALIGPNSSGRDATFSALLQPVKLSPAPRADSDYPLLAILGFRRADDLVTPASFKQPGPGQHRQGDEDPGQHLIDRIPEAIEFDLTE